MWNAYDQGYNYPSPDGYYNGYVGAAYDPSIGAFPNPIHKIAEQTYEFEYSEAQEAVDSGDARQAKQDVGPDFAKESSNKKTSEENSTATSGAENNPEAIECAE